MVHKSIKIRIYLNKTQIRKLNRIFGACRFVYNEMIAYNNKVYKESGKYIDNYKFDKLLNKWKKDDSIIDNRFSWLCDVGATKSIKDSLKQCHKAYKRAFKKAKKGIYEFPKFKSKRRMERHESCYFIKDNVDFNTLSNNVIKLPYIKYVRIKQYEYLPDNDSVISGRFIKEYGKYYVMFTYKVNKIHMDYYSDPIGIDLGIKHFATISSICPGVNYYDRPHRIIHFINDRRYRRLKDRIVKLQQIISNKVEMNYGRLLNVYLDKHHGEDPDDQMKNKLKGESYNTTQIRKLKRKLRRVHEKCKNIRKNFIDTLVNRIVVRLKPEYITIENLSITKMLQKKAFKGLSEHIQESGWRYFRDKLAQKCNEYSVELRIADRFFASSKECCICGWKNKNLKLSDRDFCCPKCGNFIDRDVNAAVNLVNTNKYTVVTC